MSQAETANAGGSASEGSPQPAGASPHLEQFTYDDGIVRMFTLATLIWGIVAMLVGLLIAMQLALPALNLGLEWTTFGRLRPLHTNAAIFAFAGNAIFAAIYYSTQRLLKTRMWSDKLGRLHFWGWQLIIVSAAVTLPLGVTQGKEYAELEWPIDLLIAIVWVGFFGVNFFMTLKVRRERHMYVAIWFYIATIVTVALLHVFNNIWVPLVAAGQPGTALGYLKSYPIYAGVQDAFMQWWYGHNAVAFFLTTPFLGLMYYFVPKAANRPVFSYRLSIIHFWSLVFIYIWAGPHHLHYTALPAWASTLGMVFSLMLWMPSWGGMINGLLTLRGAWYKVTADPVLKFFVVGITFYGMSTFEGPMLSIKSVNALSHYTDWTIGHVHSGALGWNGFMTFGMLYWLLPRLFQTKGLYSKKLAEWHFWLGTLGILVYIVAMYIAGIKQGLDWRAITPEGNLKIEFIESVEYLIPLYYLRAVGGGMYLAGVLLGAFNVYKTWKMRPKTYAEPVHTAPPLSADYTDAPAPKHRLSEHGHPELAKKVDVWMQGHWHRRWERLPLKFTVWVIVAVSVASLFEIIPTFLIRSNVPTIATVTPYSPLELAGRDIYVREGCYNCHSQMIRPMYAEKLRYGEYSKAGEFVYDRPFQWGSRRIGPDLHRVNKSYQWHHKHFEDPKLLVAKSIMPPYPHLLKRKIDWKSVPVRVRAASYLGAPYTQEQIDDAMNNAKRQAQAIAESIAKDRNKPIEEIQETQVLALIAYLDRVGKDITRTPAAEDEKPAEPGTDNAEPQGAN